MEHRQIERETDHRRAGGGDAPAARPDSGVFVGEGREGKGIRVGEQEEANKKERRHPGLTTFRRAPIHGQKWGSSMVIFHYFQTESYHPGSDVHFLHKP